VFSIRLFVAAALGLAWVAAFAVRLRART